MNIIHPPISQAAQEIVDRLLLEQGAFEPLDLLLAQGLLLYADYETWRSGGAGLLEQKLRGNPRQAEALLRQAKDYASALRLEVEPRSYRPWGAAVTEGNELHFSRNPELDKTFLVTYRKPSEAPQMDLFLDSGSTVLADGIIRALCDRDNRAASRQLQRLYAKDPVHPLLGDLEELLEAARSESESLEDPFAELDDLEQRLLPLAEKRLRNGARHFLAPFWRRLGLSLAGDPFDPTQPKRHASYPAERSEDWARVIGLVEAEPTWKTQPVLLIRHARACGRLRRESQALWSWFLLCWGFPDRAEDIGGDLEPAWRPYWREFIDLEPELDTEDFPAWLLMRQPGLVRSLQVPADAGVAPSYRVIRDILKAPGPELSPANLTQRAILRRNHPALFQHFLAARGAQA